MSHNTLQRRSIEEWQSLISEARQSGLSDAEWCRRNNISRHSFYSAIKRLRKHACEIPQRNTLVNLTNDSLSLPSTDLPTQDVVRVGIISNRLEEQVLDNGFSEPSIPLSPPAEVARISLSDNTISIMNGADSRLIAALISAVRRCS